MDIKETADYVIEVMKGQGVIVQRYNAYSTQSIYLKFDYGMAYSMRISDHAGKQHLFYRYNVRTDIKEYHFDGRGATERNFYPLNEIDLCLKHILLKRYGRIGKMGMAAYKESMERTVDRMAEKKNRFWLSCTHV